MNSLAEKITKNSYFIIVGWLATVIALILAIIIPFIQAKKICLSFRYYSNPLTIDSLSETEGLDIKYNGDPINQLTVTTCVISNEGNVTIEDYDVYKGHKLKILKESGKDRVLFASLVFQSSDTNNCRLTYTDDSVSVRFDTLEKNERIKINIYHLGDEYTFFSLDGKIKEGKIITLSPKYSVEAAKKVLPLLLISLACLYLSIYLSSKIPNDVFRNIFVIFIFVLLIVVAFRIADYLMIFYAHPLY